jgi:hypothetical protein
MQHVERNEPMNVAAANSEFRVQYRGLRGWLEQVEKMGELQHVDGAHWDVEMGAITHAHRKPRPGAGDPVRQRCRATGRVSHALRPAFLDPPHRVDLGLPLEHDRKVDIVQLSQRMGSQAAGARESRTGRSSNVGATPSTCSS